MNADKHNKIVTNAKYIGISCPMAEVKYTNATKQPSENNTNIAIVT